jgi:uncharacterized protein
VKRILLAAILCFAFSFSAFAQQNDETPASREDIQTYLETVQPPGSMKKLVDVMMKPMHQLMHDHYLKNKDKLPENFEERMNKRMNELVKNMPLEEMTQAAIPVYQRHFTKGDINTMLAFYATPTGQKILRDMPAIMSEAMEAMMPIVRRYMDDIQTKLQEETQEMMQELEKKPGQQ